MVWSMSGGPYVGVSGFSYARWKGRFYPKETKIEEFLSYYSQRLDSVEINSSFYAPPSTETVKNWSEKTSGEFKFSFKAPRQITHILKLGKDSFEATERLSKLLDSLGERRGPILFQLSPYSKKDFDLLEEFLSNTCNVKNRVFEFRHQSWLEDSTFKMLERYGVGFCIAETEDMAPTFRITGDLAYFRLRKDNYDTNEIGRWSEKIKDVAKGLGEVYAYLRHDETGENALLAQRLSEKLHDSKW